MFDKKDEKPEVKKAKKVEAPVKKKEVKKVAAPVMNELAFRAGDKVELKGLPFVVKEVKGLDVVVSREDVK